MIVSTCSGLSPSSNEMTVSTNFGSPNLNDLANVPNLTSTPHNTTKHPETIYNLEVPNTENVSNNSNRQFSVSSETKRNMLNSIKKNLNHDLDDLDYREEEKVEEKFYDHNESTHSATTKDQELKEAVNIRKQFSDLDDKKDKGLIQINLRLNSKFNGQKSIFKYLKYTVILSFGLVFIWFLISCTTSLTNSKIMSKLNDNINLSIQSVSNGLKSFLFQSNSSNLRWIQWPLRSPNSTCLSVDPIFSWFFSKYKKN